jgi:hypothetical protein
MVLIVDSAFKNEIETAFANSPLRVQVTQSVWTKVPGISNPFTSSAGALGGYTSPYPGAVPGPGGSPDGGPGAGVQPGMPGAPGTPLPGAPGQPSYGGMPGTMVTGTGAADEDMNVIELQIYGLAAIYEDPDAHERIKKARESMPPPAEGEAAAPVP